MKTYTVRYNHRGNHITEVLSDTNLDKFTKMVMLTPASELPDTYHVHTIGSLSKGKDVKVPESWKANKSPARLFEIDFARTVFGQEGDRIRSVQTVHIYASDMENALEIADLNYCIKDEFEDGLCRIREIEIANARPAVDSEFQYGDYMHFTPDQLESISFTDDIPGQRKWTSYELFRLDQFEEAIARHDQIVESRRQGVQMEEW